MSNPLRRKAVLGGVLLAATAAGAGWSWWQRRSAATAGPETAASGQDVEGLWASRFERMTGGELVMASLRGRPLVLNFWATWCPPCVKEMPELDRFAHAQGAAGWQVLALAIDQRPAVAQFLQKAPVRFPVALAGAQGTQWMRALGNPAGGLPFTVVFNARGNVMHSHLGPTNEEELMRLVTTTTR